MSELLEFDLILVEGLWHSGKSTLCTQMEKEYNYIYLQEPDHKTKNIMDTDEINDFYFEAHLNNLKSAIAHIKTGKKVIIERTVLSTVIYNVCINKFDVSTYNVQLEEFNNLLSSIRGNKCLVIMKSDIEKTFKYVSEHLSTDISKEMLANMDTMLKSLATTNSKVDKIINF